MRNAGSARLPLVEFKRYRLSTEPKFRALITDLAARLLARGYTTLPLTVALSQERFTVPLEAERFTFEDHRGESYVHCVVCETERNRRFALFVRCEDGVSRGPIGSSCLFVHVLGHAGGEEIARRLENIAHLAVHREEHTELLRSANSRMLYLKALGLWWTRNDRALRRAGLSQGQRAALAAWNRSPSDEILPLTLYEVLRAVNGSAEDLPVSAVPEHVRIAEPAPPALESVPLELKGRIERVWPKVVHGLPKHQRESKRRLLDQGLVSPSDLRKIRELLAVTPSREPSPRPAPIKPPREATVEDPTWRHRVIINQLTFDRKLPPGRQLQNFQEHYGIDLSHFGNPRAWSAAEVMVIRLGLLQMVERAPQSEVEIEMDVSELPVESDDAGKARFLIDTIFIKGKDVTLSQRQFFEEFAGLPLLLPRDIAPMTAEERVAQRARLHEAVKRRDGVRRTLDGVKLRHPLDIEARLNFVVNLIFTRRRPSEKHRIYFKERTGIDLDILRDYRKPEVIDDIELAVLVESLKAIVSNTLSKIGY